MSSSGGRSESNRRKHCAQKLGQRSNQLNYVPSFGGRVRIRLRTTDSRETWTTHLVYQIETWPSRLRSDGGHFFFCFGGSFGSAAWVASWLPGSWFGFIATSRETSSYSGLGRP